MIGFNENSLLLDVRASSFLMAGADAFHVGSLPGAGGGEMAVIDLPGRSPQRRSSQDAEFDGVQFSSNAEGRRSACIAVTRPEGVRIEPF